MYSIVSLCLVAEPDKVLVGELNEWVANPLGPGQTSALQIKTRSAWSFNNQGLIKWQPCHMLRSDFQTLTYLESETSQLTYLKILPN